MTRPSPPRLVCVGCSREAPWSLQGGCAACGALLDVEYDLAHVSIGADGPTMRRFQGLLPLRCPDSFFDSGEGHTRCLHARELGRALGLEELWLKVEADNPTRTVKDRQAPVAIAALRELGVREFVCASTGNACTAMARVMARFPDMRMHAFVGDEFLDRVAYVETANVSVYWTPHESFVGACEAAAWFARESDLPRDDGFFFFGRREGLKTVYLEAALEVNRDIEYYVQAVSSAIGVYAADRAARELMALGYTRSRPRLVCAQEASCAPMVRAFTRGAAAIEASDIVPEPRGLARATRRGDPSRTYGVIRHLVAASGGTMVEVDQVAIEAVRLTIRETEGLDVCAASAVAVAGAHALVEARRLRADAVILLNLTGGDRPPSSRPADFIVERGGTGWTVTPTRT